MRRKSSTRSLSTRRTNNEINVGLDAWCFEPVNEAGWGQLATHCGERRLSGLQWHMNGGGFKPPPLFFSVNSSFGFQIIHYSRISAIHRQPCRPAHGAPCGRPRRSGCHRLVEVRRFTIDIVQKLVEGILRGVLIPAWLRLRVLFFLFLLY